MEPASARRRSTRSFPMARSPSPSARSPERSGTRSRPRAKSNFDIFRQAEPCRCGALRARRPPSWALRFFDAVFARAGGRLAEGPQAAGFSLPGLRVGYTLLLADLDAPVDQVERGIGVALRRVDVV